MKLVLPKVVKAPQDQSVHDQAGFIMPFIMIVIFLVASVTAYIANRDSVTLKAQKSTSRSLETANIEAFVQDSLDWDVTTPTIATPCNLLPVTTDVFNYSARFVDLYRDDTVPVYGPKLMAKQAYGSSGYSDLRGNSTNQTTSSLALISRSWCRPSVSGNAFPAPYDQIPATVVGTGTPYVFSAAELPIAVVFEYTYLIPDSTSSIVQYVTRERRKDSSRSYAAAEKYWIQAQPFVTQRDTEVVRNPTTGQILHDPSGAPLIDNTGPFAVDSYNHCVCETWTNGSCSASHCIDKKHPACNPAYAANAPHARVISDGTGCWITPN